MVDGELATEDQFEAVWGVSVKGWDPWEEWGGRLLVLNIVRITGGGRGEREKIDSYNM